MITLMARLVLARLRRVDPRVAAQLKIALQSFNARSKVWTEQATPISQDVLR